MAIGMCYKCHTSNVSVSIDMSVGLYICRSCRGAKEVKQGVKK